jgi:hypothetical protein
MCGLPPAVGKEEGAREARSRGRLGVPLRLSCKWYRKWGKRPESYFCRLEGTDYSYEMRSLLYLLDDFPRFQRCHVVAGVSRGQGDVMRRYGVHIWQETRRLS